MSEVKQLSDGTLSLDADCAAGEPNHKATAKSSKNDAPATKPKQQATTQAGDYNLQNF
jgi:hypothetical protein